MVCAFKSGLYFRFFFQLLYFVHNHLLYGLKLVRWQRLLWKVIGHDLYLDGNEGLAERRLEGFRLCPLCLLCFIAFRSITPRLEAFRSLIVLGLFREVVLPSLSYLLWKTACLLRKSFNLFLAASLIRGLWCFNLRPWGLLSLQFYKQQ